MAFPAISHPLDDPFLVYNCSWQKELSFISKKDSFQTNFGAKHNSPLPQFANETDLVRRSLWMILGFSSPFFRLCHDKDCKLSLFPTNLFQLTKLEKLVNHLPHFSFEGNESSFQIQRSQIGLKDLSVEGVAEICNELCDLGNKAMSLRTLSHSFDPSLFASGETIVVVRSRVFNAFIAVLNEELHRFEQIVAEIDSELAQQTPNSRKVNLISLPIILEAPRFRLRHVWCLCTAVASSVSSLDPSQIATQILDTLYTFASSQINHRSDSIGIDVALRFLKVAAAPYISSLDHWVLSSPFSQTTDVIDPFGEVSLLQLPPPNMRSIFPETSTTHQTSHNVLLRQSKRGKLDVTDFITGLKYISQADLKVLKESTPVILHSSLLTIRKLGRSRTLLHLLQLITAEKSNWTKHMSESSLWDQCEKAFSFFAQIEREKDNVLSVSEVSSSNYLDIFLHDNLSVYLHQCISQTLGEVMVQLKGERGIKERLRTLRSLFLMSDGLMWSELTRIFLLKTNHPDFSPLQPICEKREPDGSSSFSFFSSFEIDDDLDSQIQIDEGVNDHPLVLRLNGLLQEVLLKHNLLLGDDSVFFVLLSSQQEENGEISIHKKEDKEEGETWKKVLRRVGLKYKCNWSLSRCVLFDEAEAIYSNVFGFLFLMRLALSALHSSRTGTRRNKQRNRERHKCDLLGSQLLHFINCIEHYILSQVLNEPWVMLLRSIDSAEDPDQIIEAQIKYLNILSRVCLIQPTVRALRSPIDSVFSLALRFDSSFRALFGTFPVEGEERKREIENVEKIEVEFRRTQRQVLTVVSSLATRLHSRPLLDLFDHLRGGK